MGQHHDANYATLAQAGNPTPVAKPTTCRQRCNGRNPREEPDALAGTSGSVRGALGNQRPYRDRCFSIKESCREGRWRQTLRKRQCRNRVTIRFEYLGRNSSRRVSTRKAVARSGLPSDGEPSWRSGANEHGGSRERPGKARERRAKRAPIEKYGIRAVHNGARTAAARSALP